MKGDNSTVDISMADQASTSRDSQKDAEQATADAQTAADSVSYSIGLSAAKNKVLYSFGKTVDTKLG